MAIWPSGDVTLLLHQDNIFFFSSFFIYQRNSKTWSSFVILWTGNQFGEIPAKKKNKKIKMWTFTDNQNIYQKLFSIAGKYR